MHAFKRGGGGGHYFLCEVAGVKESIWNSSVVSHSSVDMEHILYLITVEY